MTAPKDILAEHQQEIQADWERKLEAARGTAEEVPPADRVTDETDHFRFADIRELELSERRSRSSRRDEYPEIL